MIKSKKLSKYKNINHIFFNKLGGTSSGIYKSFNCGIVSSDKKKNVLKNLKIVRKKIGKNIKKIILTHQIHSNRFNFISKSSSLKKKFVGDALITDLINTPIGILTADCVPILVYDINKNTIAAIHAGWKGAYKGIIRKVINFLKKRGSKTKDIIAVIGPCISFENYEVKKDFQNKFLKKNRKNKIFFKIRKNKIYFDLNKFVYSELKMLKIKNIDIIQKDTFQIKNNFFSARRSIKLKQNDYGRNISIIMINKVFK